MNKALMLLLAGIFLTAPAFAEEIVLNSGMTVQGKMIERTDQWVRVNANGVDVTYYFDEIRLLDGKAIGRPGPEPPAVVKTQPVLSAENLNVPSEKIEAFQAIEPPREMPQAADYPVKMDEQPTVQAPPGDALSSMKPSSYGVKSSRKMKPAQAGQFILIVLALVVLGIFIVCYPVFLIAKKTNTASPYFAFIPILSYYLLCKISGRPTWWIILYLIPLVNLFVDVLVWMDIAKIRQKPAWLGVLAMIPLANIGMMWYLAMSDTKSL